MLRPFLLIFMVLAFDAHAKDDCTIDEWNTAMIAVIRTDSTAPALAVRNLSILHTAAYDILRANEPGSYLTEASLSTACYEIMSTLYPGHRAAHFDLFKSQTSGLSPEDLESTSAMGREVAYRFIRDRENDGSSQTLTYIPSDHPGHWRRTPPDFRPPELPQWPLVTPYWLKEAKQFRPPPPPALESAAYAESVNQVMLLGAKAGLSQKADPRLAEFWACFSYTATPPGHWNIVLQNLMADRAWTHLERARAYALLNTVLHDTAIAAWECKYHYKHWRPIQAIHRADEDENPATTAMPDWEPCLVAPPHPEYVSGHSSFAGAGAEVLSYLFNTDKITFTTYQDDVPENLRTYESFSECAASMGMSRIHGGIHFSYSDTEGRKLGRQVARWALEHEKNIYRNPQ